MENSARVSDLKESQSAKELKPVQSIRVTYHYRLNRENESKWLEFWNNCRHSHFQQHPLYGQMQTASNKAVIYAMGHQEGKLVCAGIFCINPMIKGINKFSEAACLRGPAFDDVQAGKEFISEIKRHFKHQNIRSISLCPYWTSPECSAVETMLAELGYYSPANHNNSRSNTGLIDISKSEEELLAIFPKKTRYEIRRAERLNVCVRAAKSSEEADQFYTNLSSMHRQKGIIDIPRIEFENAFNLILKHGDIGVLLNAYYNEEFIGGLYLFRGAKTCHIFRYVVIKSFSQDIVNLTIAPKLLWEGIKWARTKNCDTVDVECYEENLGIKHIWHNFMKTKRDFNAKPGRIIAPHIFIIDPLGCRIYRVLALGLKVQRRISSVLYLAKRVMRLYWNKIKWPKI